MTSNQCPHISMSRESPLFRRRIHRFLSTSLKLTSEKLWNWHQDQGCISFPSRGTPFSINLFLSLIELARSLYLNGNRIGSAEVEEANTSDGRLNPLTLQSTINLKAGDQIWLQIVSVSEGVVLFDRRNPYTHFTGWMLEELIYWCFLFYKCIA